MITCYIFNRICISKFYFNFRLPNTLESCAATYWPNPRNRRTDSTSWDWCLETDCGPRYGSSLWTGSTYQISGNSMDPRKETLMSVSRNCQLIQTRDMDVRNSLDLVHAYTCPYKVLKVLLCSNYCLIFVNLLW